MSELFLFGLFGIWLFYAYVASDKFRSFVRARKKLRWLKRWVGGRSGR